MAHSFGKVSYINSLPLFCAPSPFGIVEAIPSELNSMVENSRLDISLISRWIYPKVEKNYKVIPNFCIGGDGEIMSVKIFSRAPLESLADKSLFITGESGTSIRAFRYLVVEKFGFDIFKMKKAELAFADAVLLIGNKALSFDASKYAYSYDLGSMWREVLGIKMIYAVAVARREIYDDVAESVSEYFGRSLDEFGRNRAYHVARAAELFEKSEGVAIGADIIDRYYSRFIFKFGGEDFSKSFNFVSNLSQNGYL